MNIVFVLPGNLQLKFSAISPNTTVYVATDDGGNFNCNGSGDQIEINGALAYVAEKPQFTTIHLKGPNTYVISDNILIGNDTSPEGDLTTIIKLEDQANWQRNKLLITQMDSAGNHNITY